MFSSNPFPEFHSSPSDFFHPNFLFDNEKDCACFNYHQNNSDPFISGDCFNDTYNSLAPTSPAMENLTVINRDINTQQQHFSEGPGFESCQDHDDLLDSVISSFKKKTAASKKDGHSKIHTARGPRDRRMRLSIDISRKFFCLQDLLGYDKASKTLDWLFTKCKTAIKELVEETNHRPSSDATYQSKMSFLEAITGRKGGDKSRKKYELKYDDKRKKITQEPKGGFQDNLTRDQSRAFARARARERVREKMRMKELDDELKTLVHNEFHYQNFKSSAGETHRVISADPAAW